MGHRDLLELRRILRTREDMVQGNRASILTIITKFNEYKQQRIAEIMRNYEHIAASQTTIGHP